MHRTHYFFTIMPSTLSKVRKHVAKKKGDKIKSLHENSRDAARLRRASARDDRVARINTVKQKLNSRWVERVEYFKDQLPELLDPVPVDSIVAMVSRYLERHNVEISQLKAERRPGRPTSTRQTLLEQTINSDTKEFDSGFWLPNLSDDETLIKLNDWQGDWSSLANLRYFRIDSNGRVKDSQFPPRGAS